MELSQYSFWEPVLKSAGVATANKIFSIFIRLFTIPLLINYLGVERYGLWMTISSISAYVMLLDLGVGSALVNKLSTLYTNSLKESAEAYISSGIIVLSLIALMGIVLGLMILPFLDYVNILKITSHITKDEVLSTLLIAYVMYFLQLPLSLVIVIPYTMQKGSMSELSLLFGNIVGTLGLLFCFFQGKSLAYFIFFLTGPPVFAAATLLIFLCWKEIVRVNVPPLSVIKSNIDIIRGTASHFVVIQSVSLLLNTLPFGILAFHYGVGEVAPYGLMTQVIMVLQVPVLVFMKPMWTKIVQLVAEHRYDLIREVTVGYLKLAFIYVCLTSIFIIIFLNPILLHICRITIQFSLEMRVVFSIWCACGLVAGGGIGTILLALGQSRLMSIVSIVQLAVFLLCSFLIVPSKGTVGLVLSIIATYLVAVPSLILTIKDKTNPNVY